MRISDWSSDVCSSDLHPCGYGFSAQNADSGTRAATAEERAAWWSDAACVPPGNGVGIVDAKAAPPDPTLPGLPCLDRKSVVSGTSVTVRVDIGGRRISKTTSASIALSSTKTQNNNK